MTFVLMDSLEQVTHPKAGGGGVRRGGAGKVISVSTKRENGATQQPPINRLNISPDSNFRVCLLKRLAWGNLGKNGMIIIIE